MLRQGPGLPARESLIEQSRRVRADPRDETSYFCHLLPTASARSVEPDSHSCQTNIRDSSGVLSPERPSIVS